LAEEQKAFPCREFNTLQGVSAHRARSHGYRRGDPGPAEEIWSPPAPGLTRDDLSELSRTILDTAEGKLVSLARDAEEKQQAYWDALVDLKSAVEALQGD
jgi:hypothetical protein